MVKLSAVKELVRMANDLDSKGLYKEADVIDSVLLKIAETPENSEYPEYPGAYGPFPEKNGYTEDGLKQHQASQVALELQVRKMMDPKTLIKWTGAGGYNYKFYPNNKDPQFAGIIFVSGGPRSLNEFKIRPGANNYRKALEEGIQKVKKSGEPDSGLHVTLLERTLNKAPPDRALTLKEIGTAPSATVMGRKPEADLDSTLEDLRTSPPSRPLPPAPHHKIF